MPVASRTPSAAHPHYSGRHMPVLALLSMATNATRLARIFTSTYAAKVNAQLVYPATSVIVKPNELESALARPLHTSYYEPDNSPAYFAAQLSYGIIMGHPFLDGNKRTGLGSVAVCLSTKLTNVFTAFFLTNEYLRAQSFAGLVGQEDKPLSEEEVRKLSERFISVAKGKMKVDELAHEA